jgi:succinate dehydrogenase/fumarate reductase flavoprotein subunit
LDSHIRKQENVTVKTETNIKKISRNHSGGIKGVTLNDGTSISAPTLIVACGGFEANNGLKRDLLGPRRIGLLGSPANTGDGVRLAEKVGARIWHHAAEASVLGFLPPDTDTGFALALRHPGFIFVNRHGERFINECKLESHRGHSDTAVLDHETGTYVHDPIWLIMDEENMNHDSAPVLDIFSNKVVREGYQWSKYSKDEIEKGWVQKADSVEQLAETLDIDSEKLETNIEKYNKHPKETPDPFNRDPASLRPLHPPFYALRLTPLLYNTQAGPQRNEFAEVIDPDGEVIPGLYGAGECGSIWGHAYQSSTNFAETIVFGRIAGREAARFARRLDAGEHEQRKTEAGDPPTKVPEDQFEKS